jgi:hypothetical protein
VAQANNDQLRVESCKLPVFLVRIVVLVLALALTPPGHEGTNLEKLFLTELAK